MSACIVGLASGLFIPGSFSVLPGRFAQPFESKQFFVCQVLIMILRSFITRTASYQGGGLLMWMWMLHLYLHVNQKSDDDDDDDDDEQNWY